jgi:predicted TIM-barrel fold metal-dependent hydrolase
MTIFDAHFHVIDPRFALVANEGYVPDAFTVDDYRTAVAPLGVTGGAVVAGSFQGFDQAWLVDALEKLGDGFVGVAQLPAHVTDAAIERLGANGVRAARANLRRGMASFDEVERLARRVHDLAGWHLEIYADASTLDVARVCRLPCVVVDHLGLTDAGLEQVRRIAAEGHYVKATGFGRVERDVDVAAALRSIAAANPDALVFGTDLPSTRSPRPFTAGDLQLVREVAGEAAVYDNARRLYRLG